MKKTGIVILNYNSYQLIVDKLELLKSYNCINEIIIVDNCSTNDSFKILKKLEDKKIKVVQTDKNGGYAYGNNYGLKILEKNNDYAFVLNPDVIIDNENLEKIIDHMNNNTEYAILGALRTSVNNVFDQSQFWNVPTFLSELGSYLFIFRKISVLKEIKYIKTENRIMKVGVVPGCLFLVNLKILKYVNYFDENTFLYYEENILAKKIQSIGFKSGICLNAKYIHDHQKSSTKTGNNKVMKKYLYDSKKYFYEKYLNLGIIQKGILSLLNKINRLERGIYE